MVFLAKTMVFRANSSIPASGDNMYSHRLARKAMHMRLESPGDNMYSHRLAPRAMHIRLGSQRSAKP